MKQPSPLFLLPQTLQLSLCIGVGSILLASAKNRFIRRPASGWSVIHYAKGMCFHCPGAQWRRALHHSSRRLALSMVILGLCVAAWLWKPADSASRGSLELCSDCCTRGPIYLKKFIYFCFSTRQSHSACSLWIWTSNIVQFQYM